MLRQKLRRSCLATTTMGLVVLALTSACGDQTFSLSPTVLTTAADGGSTLVADGGSPTVLSTTPSNGGTGIPVSGVLSVIFSEAMNSGSLSPTTFMLRSGGAPIAGAVVYANGSATFSPAARLASNSLFVATITTGATSTSGSPLAASHSWSFTTGTDPTAISPVELGSAADFAVLAKAGIFTSAASAITGDIGVSPAAATYITGFSLSADSSNVFSTTPQVVGKVYAADYMTPTPSNLAAAVGDIDVAFTDAATRTPKVRDLQSGIIGGLNLVPGVYEWGTDLSIPADLTLTGNATDVWVFQVAQNVSISNAARVVLSGGASTKNVFWQVAGTVNLGVSTHFEGIVLAQEAVTVQTSASMNGRVLAKTSITLAGNTIVEPGN
jgi:Ice-binding-like/Bacterial Ig-like domain